MSTDTHPLRAAPASPVRASDAERAEIVARLHHALGEGRLDLAETEERVAAAYAASYRDDLSPLLADLPGGRAVPPEPGSAPPAWTTLWTSLVWRARTVVFGPAAAGAPPTAAQCRTAAVLAALALVWMTLCAFLGAAAVGA
jgi:hypothetical protein